MYDQNMINQLWANAASSPPRQGSAVMGSNGQLSLPGENNGKKKKSFWVDQISTATGIGGGILGSFVAPVLGTAAGAGVGSLLGEAIENAITGNKLTDNLVKEGALGAVFGAGPMKLAKGGFALAKGAGVQGAKEAALTPLRKSAGQALTGAADDLAVKTFRLTPTQLRNFQGKFNEDAGSVIRRYGFQNLDDITKKGIEPLQQQFDSTITAIPGVTKESLKQNLTKRIDKLSSAGPSDTKAIGAQLQKEANNLLNGFGDVVDAKELNMIRRQFDDLVNYTEKVANPARYGVNKRMADAIRETLQKADPTGQLKQTGRELNMLRQLADNAAKQGQLGRGSLPLGLSTLLGGVAGGAAFGPAGIGTAAGVAAVNSNTGRRFAQRAVEGIGNRLTASGTKAAGQSGRGIATRLGVVGGTTGLMNQANQQASTLEDAILSQSLDSSAMAPNASPNSIAAMNTNMDLPYQDMAQQSTPYSAENLLYDIQRDPQNADKYMEVYAMFEELFNPQASQEKPLSAEASKVVSNANIGLQALDDFEMSVQQDPSVLAKRVIPGRNALGGALGGVLGTRGIDAASQQIIDVIARLRTGAAITNDEAKRFEQFIPTAADDPSTRAQKLSYLRNQFNAVAQRSMAGGTDLESALLQTQSAY